MERTSRDLTLPAGLFRSEISCSVGPKMRLWCGKYSVVVFALRFTGRTAKCKWPLVCFICVYLFEFFVVLQLYGLWCVQRLLRTEISFMVRGLIRDTAINQVNPPRCENELRFVWLSRGLRLPSEASFCGAFPLRRMFLPKAATFALHDPRSDGFATDFCETRYRLRNGNAPKRRAGRRRRSRSDTQVPAREHQSSAFINPFYCRIYRNEWASDCGISLRNGVVRNLEQGGMKAA